MASDYLFLQLGVFGFGLSIDGKIGIGIFPNVKEFFVRFAGGCVVAHHLLRAAQLEPGQGSDDMSHAKTRIVDQLLELSRGRLAIAEPQDMRVRGCRRGKHNRTIP